MAQKQPNPPVVHHPEHVSALNGVTKSQMEQAFEAWEKGYRIEPEKYRRPEECAFLSVSQVSAERADYFFELLGVEQRKGNR